MVRSADRGVFVTLEGGEGAGKSTQIGLLSEKLSSLGVDFVVTREPGGTMLGERIRHLLKDYADDPPNSEAELLLFLAARAQLVRKVVLPALESGKWVLSDRFSDSTFAYQSYARGLDFDSVRGANSFACAGLKPDITFLLDLDGRSSLARRAAREAATGSAADRFEREGDAFHSRLREGFLEMAAGEPSRIKVVDASLPPQEVLSEIWKYLKPMI